MMKKLISIILSITLLFGCISFASASGEKGQKNSGQIQGCSIKAFNGSIYGYYIGDPDSDVVIMVGLGSSQGAYDSNALPSYVNEEWKDKNVYWYKPELPYASSGHKRIDMGYSLEKVDVFAEAHMDKAQEIFPNAQRFVVGGYSAGGYTVPSMVNAVQNTGKQVAAIYDIDGVPKDSIYGAFVNMMEEAKASNIPTFLATSSKSPSKNGRIEVRSSYYMKNNPDIATISNNYAGKGTRHGNLCVNTQLRADFTEAINEWTSGEAVTPGTSGNTYGFTIKGVPQYDATNKNYVITYETNVDGRVVPRTETIPIANIGGLTSKNANTAVGQKIATDFAIRYGKLLMLVDGQPTDITLTDLVSLWDDDAIGGYLSNPNVKDTLCNAYRNHLVKGELQESVYDMLLSTSEDQFGYRVVDLGENKYIMDGYTDVMSGDQVANTFAKTYLSEQHISTTSLDALDKIWSLGLYDDLNDDARIAFNKRMAEQIDPNTNSYKFSNGQTWVRPGSGYKVLPLDVFSNVINGMSISKLKEWKKNGTYDGLAGVQKNMVDAQIKAIETRESKATSVSFIAKVAETIGKAIKSINLFQKSPQKSVDDAMAKGRSFLEKKALESKAAAEKAAGNTAEKEYSISFGGTTRKVKASSYQAALDKVKVLEKNDGESSARQLDVQFSTDARKYTDAIKASVSAAVKGVTAGISSFVTGSGKVGSQSASSSSSSGGIKQTSNIITAAIKTVVTVATAVVTGIKAISAITKSLSNGLTKK